MRIGLFILVNILIMLMISVVTRLLGLEGYMTASGINYQSLMVFCLIWGMGGSFISLAISKWMAKKMFRIQMIDPNSPGAAGEIARTVHRLAQSAGLSKMPEVGIYPSPEVNAFATGPTKNSALVAVSEGLLHRMNRDELEGVLAHEVGHIANGDMVTMTLIQGVVNAFVMFLARVLAFAISSAMRSDDEESSGGGLIDFVLVIVFQILFGILGSMVTGWFSRHREFRADKSGAKLAGKQKMIAALERLRNSSDEISPAHESMAALKISGRRAESLMALLSTHPPLERRINALRSYT